MVLAVREGATPEERADERFSGAESAETAESDGAADSARRLQLGQEPGELRAAGATAAVPYPLASRTTHPDPTVVQVGNVEIGGPSPVVIAGPCSVESEAQIVEAARAARASGARLLRGGAFKPRTSPYSFQGLGLDGLKLLAEAGHAAELPIVTEVMEPDMVGPVAEYADVLQVGSRNMQNFPLLRAVGRAHRPVLLKRGFAATIEEWLLAAEYILVEGNTQVILCERGVRSFDPQTRNLLDLACVPLLKELTHLPVLVDPSHGTGRSDLVVPMGVAAIAAGADGLIVEMHPHPRQSLSDADQAITPMMLRALIERVYAVRAALNAVHAVSAFNALTAEA